LIDWSMRPAILLVALLLFSGLLSPQAFRYFPDSSFWSTDISAAPLHPDSPHIINFLSKHGGFDGSTQNLRIDFSMTVNTADANTPRVPVTAAAGYYHGECDDPENLPLGLGFPIPAGGFIEGGVPLDGDAACSGDCHLLVVDSVNNFVYESYESNFDGKTLSSGCVVVWNSCHEYPLQGRGEQCTSTDAGGLSVTAGVVRVEEVANKNIDHAMRFILPTD